MSGYADDERRKLNKAFAENILKTEVEPGLLTDVEAFAKIADFVAYVAEDDSIFVEDLTMLFVGVERLLSLTFLRRNI